MRIAHRRPVRVSASALSRCVYTHRRMELDSPSDYYSDNLSLIESGRASQAAESHAVRAGVCCDRPAERQVENASRTRKRTLHRHDKRNESRLQLFPLPSAAAFFAFFILYPLPLAPPRRAVPTREHYAEWTFADKKETKFPIRRVSAFPIYLPCRRSFSSRRGAPVLFVMWNCESYNLIANT